MSTPSTPTSGDDRRGQMPAEQEPSAQRAPAGATASGIAEDPAAAGPVHPEPPTARRHPWRRFHHHASE